MSQFEFLGNSRLQPWAIIEWTGRITGGFGMAYSVTLKRGGRVLEQYEFEVENPDDIRAHVDAVPAAFDCPTSAPHSHEHACLPINPFDHDQLRAQLYRFRSSSIHRC